MSAVHAVNTEIFDALSGADATEQQQIDADLISLDGTENKARLGANAILGSVWLLPEPLPKRQACLCGVIWVAFMHIFSRHQ